MKTTMRRLLAGGLGLTAMFVVAAASLGALAPPASAKTGEESFCPSNSGSIRLSPGLQETAQVQNIVIKGKLSEYLSTRRGTGLLWI